MASTKPKKDNVGASHLPPRSGDQTSTSQGNSSLEPPEHALVPDVAEATKAQDSVATNNLSGGAKEATSVQPTSADMVAAGAAPKHPSQDDTSQATSSQGYQQTAESATLTMPVVSTTSTSPVAPPAATAPPAPPAPTPPALPLTTTAEPNNKNTVDDSNKWDLGRRKDQQDATLSWSDCTKVLKDHHEAMLLRWKEEIDTLLVYAGLFSTVLTAFIVESYSHLRPNSMDTTNALLVQMSAQMASFRINTAFANSTQPIVALASPSSFRAARSSVWINALWFSSLICSLSAASLGMIVKQWLHQNALDVAGTSRDIVRLRQYRYDALTRWHVPTIVAVLPLLLLLASGLFFGGLLILLWSLHRVIAGIASALLSALLVFAVTTTFVPAFSRDCAYRSPQSLAAYLVIQAAQHLASTVYSRLPGFSRDEPIATQIDGKPQPFTSRGWSDLEHTYVGSNKQELDQKAIIAAHNLSPQDQFTDMTLRPCIRTLPPAYGYECIKQIQLDMLRETSTSLPTTKSSSTSIGIRAALIFDVIETYTDAVQTATGVERGNKQGPELNDLFEDLIKQLTTPPLAPWISYAAWASTPERLYRTLSKLIQRSIRVEEHIEDVSRIADNLVNWQYLWSLYRLGLVKRPRSTLSSGDLRLVGGLLLTCKQGTRQVITQLEALLVWAADKPLQLALAHERLLAFLCTCSLAPEFIEVLDRDFVSDHLLIELKAFEEFVTEEDPDSWGVGDMFAWIFDGPTSARAEWQRRLGVGDGGGQTIDANIPPIDATVPELRDGGLITRGTVIFLPTILSKLLQHNVVPRGLDSATSKLAKQMVRIMDYQTGDDHREGMNRAVYEYLNSPWHKLDKDAERSNNPVPGNKGSANHATLNANAGTQTVQDDSVVV